MSVRWGGGRRWEHPARLLARSSPPTPPPPTSPCVSAGAVGALILGANAARGHRQKLRAFLADVVGEEQQFGGFPLEKAE